jgi:hypothetical protein
LSRACLGKLIIVFSIKLAQKRRFPHHAVVARALCAGPVADDVVVEPGRKRPSQTQTFSLCLSVLRLSWQILGFWQLYIECAKMTFLLNLAELMVRSSAKNDSLFFQHFLVFVPSLSWQSDRVDNYRNGSKRSGFPMFVPSLSW